MKKFILLTACIAASYAIYAQNVGIGESSPASKGSVKGNLSVGSNYSTVAAPADGAIIEGNVGIGTTVPNVKLDISATDAINFPKGTTLQRPANPQAGYTRFNTESKAIEYYDGTQWVSSNMEQTPVGTISPYGGSAAPSGWLICNGAGVSTATYPELFAIIGYAYGGSSGTFNLPDLRGKTAFGLGASAPFNTLGATGGSTSQTPTITTSGLSVDIAAFNAALPNHTHTIPPHYHSIGTGASLTTTATNSGNESQGHTHTFNGTTSLDGNHNHGIRLEFGTGNNLNSGPPGTYNQVTNAANYGFQNSSNAQIETKGAHTHNYNGTTNGVSASHTHTIPSVAVTGTIGLFTGGENGNAAMTSGNPSAANISVDPPSTSVSGAATSSAVNVTNPYQVINYIIKATNTSPASIVAVNIPSGTLGQTLYNNGSNWTPTSNVYNNGTNVGIGTTSPSAVLDVNGTVRLRNLTAGVVKSDASGNLSSSLVTNADVADVAWGKLTGTPTTLSGYGITDAAPISGGANYIQNQTAANQSASFRINGNGIFDGGNVGIGIVAPTYKLQVSADVISQLSAYNPGNANGKTAGIRFHTGSGWEVQLRTRQDNSWLELADAIGNVNHRWNALNYHPGNSAAYLTSGTSNQNIALMDGNLGIGIANPGTKLDVIGTMQAGTSTGKMQIANDNANGSITNTAGSFLHYTPANTNYIWHAGGTERMRVESTGKARLTKSVHAAGADDFSMELYAPVDGNGNGEISIRFHKGNGFYHQIRCRSGLFRFTEGGGAGGDNGVPIWASAFTSTSDGRIKENKTAIDYGLKEIMMLKPMRYNEHQYTFQNKKLELLEKSKNDIGFIAQEVYKIIPEAAFKPEDENQDIWGMNYPKLIPVLTKAIQEQQAQIETLKKENQDLKTENIISDKKYSELKVEIEILKSYIYSEAKK